MAPAPPHPQPQPAAQRALPGPPGYPATWEFDVALSDGSTAHLRPIRPDDADRLARFHARQSPESIYFRYFSPRPQLSERDLEHLTTVDYVDRMAFVALRGDELVGVARYDRWQHRSQAEVAFFIDDEHHGRGIATLMLEHLAARAREVGISAFTASVLPDNRRMIGVFTKAGFTTTSRFADGVIEVRLELRPTPEAEAAIEARAATAASRAVARLLEPRSVAVIGASRERGTIGHDVFRNILLGGFEGPVWPVNPEAVHVASVRTVASILDIPDDVDVAVIAVPAAHVAQVLEECGQKKVYAAVVLSAGFAERGPQGASLESEALRVARRHGMRLLGPASLGIINTDPTVGLHGTFAAPNPLPGRVALLSESGMVGAAIIDRAREIGVGISSFVGLGNRADVSGNDLLSYWASDTRTDVVCMYIESIGNPRHFSRIARRLSRVKPVVAVCAGRPAGSSHEQGGSRGRLVDALFEQAGVIRARTLAELLEVARLLAHQPLPPGPNVAVVGNAGGSLAIAAEACLDAGLRLAALSPETAAQVEPMGGLHGSGNPLDLGLTASGSDFERATGTLLGDEGVDAVLAVYGPSLGAGPDETGRALGAAYEACPGKPVVACFFGPERVAALPAGQRAIPVYSSVEPAARALGKVAVYAEWRGQEEGSFAELDERLVADLRALLAQAAPGPTPTPLPATEVWRLLERAGITVAATRLAPEVDTAVRLAGEVGWPVALKAPGRDRLAKTQAAGLALDLHDESSLRNAWATMAARWAGGFVPAVVQHMEEPGVDIAVRAYVDPGAGPVVSVKAGGAAGVLDPAADLRVLPLTDADAQALVAGARLAPLLDEAARAKARDLLLSVAALVESVPELAEVELDPVIVRPDAAVVLDAAVRVARPESDPMPHVRRLGA